MTDLLLSRTMAMDDFTTLTRELDVVDECADGSLSAERRWEYGLALHAIRRRVELWKTDYKAMLVCAVGAPPVFLEMLTQATVIPTLYSTIDPLAQLLTEDLRYAQLADVVVCLSLVDRIGDLEHFLYLLSCIVAPGGLLVLTMAFWNNCGSKDTAHHHQLRERIFCPKSYAALRTQLSALNLQTWGGLDPCFHGTQIHDYTLASLVLEKRA